MPGQSKVVDHLAPDKIAVALDDRMRAAVLRRLFGKEGGVNAAEDDPRAALAGDAADFVATPGVSGVDANADDVAGGNRVEFNLIGSVSSTRCGSTPQREGVAPASTYSQRGVITATPKET